MTWNQSTAKSASSPAMTRRASRDDTVVTGKAAERRTTRAMPHVPISEAMRIRRSYPTDSPAGLLTI